MKIQFDNEEQMSIDKKSLSTNYSVAKKLKRIFSIE